MRLAVIAAIVLATHDAYAQSCKIPGFTDAAFGDDGVTLTGNACTDSFDSSVPPGTYAGTKCSPPGTPCVGGVGTNAIGAGAITLSGGNACVKGACQIGFGGSTGNISGSSKCTSTAVEPAKVELASVTAPSLPSASPYNITSPATMTPGKAYGTVSGSGNSGNVINLSAGSYVMHSLKLSGQSSLKITSGPVLVYLTGAGSSLDLSGNGINNVTGVATNLIFMCTDAVTDVKVVGNGTTAFGLYCPKASIQVSGNGEVYGAVVGKTVTMTGNGGIHYDKALGNVTSGQISCTTTAIETSRASPIVASLTPNYGGAAQTTIVQGTFEANGGAAPTIATTADIAGWSFPYIKGHMRARIASSITTTASAFGGTVCTAAGTPSGCSVLFDAGATGNIPAMGTFSGAGCTSPTGTCRHIFTNTNATSSTGVTRLPTTLNFSGNNASTIGPLLAPASSIIGITPAQQQTVMQKVLQGRLGGVDRSTVAVIGPSTLAGSGTRPTIAYFGAADGMLHAVCASQTATGPCAGRVGTELWAFMPRVQLPYIRTNTARIDGSPHVTDAFGDFDNNGTSEWATVLVFQTGFGTGATYALNVTDPANPRVLWEVTAPSTGTTELGTGLIATSARYGGSLSSIAVVVTNNGGDGGAGVVATALALDTGAEKWQFGYVYPGSPRGVAADGPLPVSAIPGGAVGVDIDGRDQTTDFVFGDIYGNLWRLDATTGVSRNGTATPLFSFSTNKHPIGATPAVYSSGGRQFAVFASGGYTDHGGSTSWRTSTQYVIAVRLDSTGSTVDETAMACANCSLGFKQTTSGQYGFSQVLVVGTQLFVTTDTTDINAASYGTGTNTGTVTSVDLVSAGVTTAVVAAGASSLAVNGTTLISSGGQKQQQTTSTDGSTGVGVDISLVAGLTRLLWLRLE